MEIKFSEHNGWSIFDLDGKLNIHSVQELKFALSKQSSVSNRILLNFEKVVQIDSVGISCLLYCLQKIRESDGALRISGLNDQVKIIFQVTRGYEIFDIYAAKEIQLVA